MKKLSVFLDLVFVIGLSSCKKDYTCTCNTTISYDLGGIEATPEMKAFLPQNSTATSSETRKLKKKDAEDWCKGNEGTSSIKQNAGFITVTQTTTNTCSL